MSAGIVVLIVLGLLVVGTGVWFTLHHRDRGTGAAPVTETVRVGPFRGVAIDGEADVILVPGGDETVMVELPARSRGRVRVDIDGGVLKLGYRRASHWWDEAMGRRAATPRITINFRRIDRVRTSGKVKLVANGLHTDDLEVRASGAGTLTLTDLQVRRLDVEGTGALQASIVGRVDTQRIWISGAGDYRAPDLVSNDVSVRVSGAGRVVVNAQRTLDVSLSGAGNVEYVGNPKVTKHVTGMGQVKRRDEAASHTDFIAAARAPRRESFPA
jgi:hypothetical protein